MADLTDDAMVDQMRRLMVARLEAERFGPVVHDFGPVDGPQRQQMLADERRRALDAGAVDFLAAQRERAQQEYDRRVARKSAAREAT